MQHVWVRMQKGGFIVSSYLSDALVGQNYLARLLDLTFLTTHQHVANHCRAAVAAATGALACDTGSAAPIGRAWMRVPLLSQYASSSAR